jgi:dTDP-4-dehydrorhamnose reductase
VTKHVDAIRPSAVVHAAALVGAKECEENKAKAYVTNVVGTHNVAKVCQIYDIKVIYISTDTVFDGEDGNYTEEDTPNPINYYSLTKLLGEASVKMLDSYLIIRTSFYSPDSFKYSKAFTDQYTCRMRTDELAMEIMYALEKDVRGVVHIAGERSSLYEKIRQFNPAIGKITRAETGLILPKDLSLNTEKWRGIKNEPKAI